jgi:hypothetical protein
MRLEKHVGGMGRARQENYLAARGWRSVDGRWVSPTFEDDPLPIQRALHRQLTADLAAGLSPHGWKIVGYSPRGYAKLQDPVKGDSCTLPGALRRQAKREGRKVAELTYSLFLAAIL